MRHLPGLSGQMYRNFALVLATTALLSAINAATLRPTQCALWLRRAGRAALPAEAGRDQPAVRTQRRRRMVPLGTMVDISYRAGPVLIDLYDLSPAAQILGMPNLDFSTGQAMALLEQIADDTLPPGMGVEWTGISYQFFVVLQRLSERRSHKAAAAPLAASEGHD